MNAHHCLSPNFLAQGLYFCQVGRLSFRNFENPFKHKFKSEVQVILYWTYHTCSVIEFSCFSTAIFFRLPSSRLILTIRRQSNGITNVRYPLSSAAEHSTVIRLIRTSSRLEPHQYCAVGCALLSHYCPSPISLCAILWLLTQGNDGQMALIEA